MLNEVCPGREHPARDETIMPQAEASDQLQSHHSKGWPYMSWRTLRVQLPE